MSKEQIAVEQENLSNDRERHDRSDDEERTPLHEMRKALEEAGEKAVPLVWIAFSFWLLVEMLRRLKGWLPESARKFGRTLVRFLREHHRVVGWLAFGFAAVHSLYYLALWVFKAVDFKAFTMWSGVAAFVPFLLLTVWGEWLQRHGRDRTARKIHWALAVVMAGGMIVHELESFGKLLLVFGAFTRLYVATRVWERYLLRKTASKSV
jgi:hypothetical protein